jgi:ACT domain-containing protein
MDKALLQYEMNKNGIGIGELCKKIGMSRSAFYRKCNGKSEFTQGEIQAIVDLLHLESPVAIFFAK